jgi:hypothetical protein
MLRISAGYLHFAFFFSKWILIVDSSCILLAFFSNGGYALTTSNQWIHDLCKAQQFGDQTEISPVLEVRPMHESTNFASMLKSHLLFTSLVRSSWGGVPD